MKYTLIIIILALFLTGCTAPVEVIDVEKEDIGIKGEMKDIVEDVKDLVQKEEIKIPSTLNMDVEFQSQAPHGNWDLPYQEACEEATLIQVAKYFKEEALTKDIMDQEIKALVDWQNEIFGSYTDTALSEVLIMAEDFYGLNVVISEDVTIENIKKELANGNLIIVPTAGRLLGNPNFSGLGPISHYLVIRGYDRNEFITNDVGTRKGDGYKYKYNTLINAIYDLPVDESGKILRLYDMDISDSEKAELMLTGDQKILIIQGR